MDAEMNRTYVGKLVDRKKYENLFDDLLDLYGKNNLRKDQILSKALLDKVISKEEYDNIKFYCF